ncbi:MAG: c-type cytochrome biogenesis protein CcmI [Pseudomonadota bacterium]
MLFWLTAFLIAVLTAGSLLVVLRRPDASRSAAASDVQVYRDQLKEVERDLARGVLTEAEAETVRVEVSRRLLDADRRAEANNRLKTGAQAPIVVIVSVVLLVGGATLYRQIGAPGYPDLPMGQRLAAINEAAANRPDQLELERRAAPNIPAPPAPEPRYAELMDELRAAIEERPDDLTGLTLLAENEARLGNLSAAREAQARILAIKGDAVTAADLIDMIDIMVYAAGGYVSPEAEDIVRQLFVAAPQNGTALYYAGLTLAQNGRPDQAFPIWRRLLESGPRNAPWVPIITAEIESVAAAAGVQYQHPRLTGPSAEDIAAMEALSDTDRRARIEGMVEGLAARLATEGGTAEEWAQLITALGVRGERERAGAILEEARIVFAESGEALALIEQAAARAGLSE